MMIPSQETSHTITEKSQSNFSSSFFFLSSAKRRAMEAVYAFCRLVDDAVDESASPSEAMEKLKDWSTELEAVYRGKAHYAATKELAWAVSYFSIPKKYFEELILGVGQDLEKTRYQNFEELCSYTYGVASVVGLMCMKIFGVEGEEANQAAILLGRALQLTNVLRDIKKDAISGRIYLPLKDLQYFSVREEEVLQGKQSVRFDSFMYYEIGQTEAVYAEAFRLMKNLPYKPLLAAWVMGKVYYRILQEIKKNPRLPLSKKVSLSKWVKFNILMKEWMRSWF